MELKQIINLSNKAFKENNFQEAKKLLDKAIKLNPNNYEFHHRLGIINYNLGNIENSINCFKKAISINPKSSATLSNLANIYSKLNKIDLALKNYLQAIEMDPKNFNAYYNLGNFYLKIDDINNAEKYFNLSIDLSPNQIYPYNNLFQLYDRSNDLEKLEKILIKAKKNLIEDSLIKFFEGILNYRKKNYRLVINIFEELELDQKDIPKNILKNNILAKSYDHIGMFEDAFKFYTISNDILEKASKKNFNKERYINSVTERIDFFSNINLRTSRHILSKKKEKDPIFLIGFPRSGTTLLDTILRTHNSIEVLEEKSLVEESIIELNISNNFDKIEKIDNSLLEQIRKSYFKKRENFFKTDSSKIYIDKLPLNIIYLAEINKLFPDAKYILALRHPCDAVLSCFMQPFTPNDAMSNFFNLNDAAYLYDKIMELWTKYEKTLDLVIHTIKYEDVVNNFEPTLKNLLNFLEISWNDSLKEFYKTAEKKRFINTPSYDQVNMPLYDKSIERWKNYKEKFSVTNNILDKWINKFNY